MKKEMKLKGRILLTDGVMQFTGYLHDKTQFSLYVTEHDVELNEDFTELINCVDGWLFVLQEAKQDTRCYLTLPKATTRFGKQVVVHELDLNPRNLNINSFNPKKQENMAANLSKSKKAKKTEISQEVIPDQITDFTHEPI